jgi:hypothetical protein
MTVITVYEDSRGSGRCRACHASVIWVETVAGKRMPFNPPWRPTPTEIRVHGRRVVDLDPQQMITHFATCPFADHFRTKKRSSHV